MAWTSDIKDDRVWFNHIPLYSGVNSIDWDNEGTDNSVTWDKDSVSALDWINVLREDNSWTSESVSNLADWIAPDLLDAILLDKSFDAASESYFHTLGKFFGEPPLRGWNDEAASSSSWDKDSSVLPTWLKGSSSPTTWS